MHKNFIVRFWCSLFMIALTATGLLSFHGLPFKIIYGLAVLCSLIELFSFARPLRSPLSFILTILEASLLLASIFIFAHANVKQIIFLLIGACSYDIFAYLIGKIAKHRLFPHSRPFPHISKNKTWEGTLAGLICSFFIIYFLFLLYPPCSPIFYLTGLLALLGDLLESLIKRHFKIKDSNQNLLQSPFFAQLELLVGGDEGHGGYLDRLDSLALASLLLLFI